MNLSHPSTATCSNLWRSSGNTRRPAYVVRFSLRNIHDRASSWPQHLHNLLYPNICSLSSFHTGNKHHHGLAEGDSCVHTEAARAALQVRECTYTKTRQVICVSHTFQAHSPNHFAVKELWILNTLSVFILALVARHAIRKFSGTYCHLWRVWLHHIFSHYLKNGKMIEEKFIEYKMCFDCL